MLYKMEQYISNSLTEVLNSSERGLRVKYTANTGMGLISAANTNLDGTGTIVNIITGATKGTLVERIIIKSTVSTTRGMVRLFISDSPSSPTFTELFVEINIPERTVSSVDQAFCTTIKTNFMLKSGWVIRASTQNAESFQVIAEGLDTAFP